LSYRLELDAGKATGLSNETPQGVPMTKLIEFFRDEQGATAIEYGLIAGLISVGLLVALTDIGTSLQTIFSTIATSLGTVG
jgi:pilus assembly protein Flp/PilA